jgi:hypothetical protein
MTASLMSVLRMRPQVVFLLQMGITTALFVASNQMWHELRHTRQPVLFFYKT